MKKREIIVNKTVGLTLRQIELLEKIAHEDGVTKTDVLRAALDAYFERHIERSPNHSDQEEKNENLRF